MSEIIREALVYVAPNSTKEEASDPKAKGAKVKAPTDSVADIFSGQDTTLYKEISTLILQ